MSRFFENPRHYLHMDIEARIAEASSPCQALAALQVEFEAVLAEAVAWAGAAGPTAEEAEALQALRQRIVEIEARKDPEAPCAAGAALSEAEARARLEALFGG